MYYYSQVRSSQHTMGKDPKQRERKKPASSMQVLQSLSPHSLVVAKLRKGA
jgi:hypothetical protein